MDRSEWAHTYDTQFNTILSQEAEIRRLAEELALHEASQAKEIERLKHTLRSSLARIEGTVAEYWVIDQREDGDLDQPVIFSTYIKRALDPGNK